MEVSRIAKGEYEIPLLHCVCMITQANTQPHTSDGSKSMVVLLDRRE